MTGQKTMRGFKFIKFTVSFGLLLLFFWLIISYFSLDLFKKGLTSLKDSPILLLIMFTGYLSAFWLRALGWQMYLSRKISISHCMYGLFYSLFFNHLLPVKAGDLIRIGYLASLKTGIRKKEIIESVVVLRVYDLFVLGAISLGFGALIGVRLAPHNFYAFAGIICSGLFLIYLLRSRIPILNGTASHLLRNSLSVKSAVIFLLVASSWMLEAAVVYGTALSFSVHPKVWHSIWVNSLTIAGQVFHFTPGGLGTYEAAMSSALAAIGITPAVALQIAIISHLFKFVFSYLAGAFTLLCAPVSFQRVRLWLKQKKEVKQS